MQAQKARQGYKLVKSFFGKYEEIPEKWNTKKFDELFEFLRTGTNSRSDLDTHGDVQYIHYGDIHTKWNSILDCDLEEIPFIDKSKVESLPLLKDGDLVIADASEDYEGSGVSVLLKNVKNRKIVSGLHTIVLRSVDENISSDFKRYLTSIRFVKNQIIGRVTGISVYGLSKNNLKTISILLPTLPEQQKIASILSNVDSQINQTQKEIEHTQRLKKGLLQKLLTKGIGHTKFEKVNDRFKNTFEIPLEWNYLKIAELLDKKIILEIQDGNHGELHPKLNDFVEKGIPFITADCLIDNKIDYTKCKFLPNIFLKSLRVGFAQKNDVLLSHKGSIGYTAIMDGRFNTIILTPQTTYYRLSNHLSPQFLFYVFQSYDFQKQLFALAVQTTRNYVGILNQRHLYLPLVPLDEQQKIVKILSTVDLKISTEKEYRSKLETLKKGLMQKLLTGQIRVSV